MDNASIARVAHEINKAYCEAIGDSSQAHWEEAPEWLSSSVIAGVSFHRANPEASPADLHKAWLGHKEAEGWEYGEVKDAEAKTHPCFLPYEELPLEHKVKDFLFSCVVRELTAYTN